MSPRPNPVTAVTGTIGVVTRRTLAFTGRVVLSGISTSLSLVESSRRAQQTTKKYADAALQLAATTPLGRLLPSEQIDDGAAEEAERILSRSPNGGPSRPVAVPTPPAEDKPAATKPAEKPPVAPRPEPIPGIAKELGAPGAAAAEAQAAVRQAVNNDGIPAEPERADLPIDDYDSASLPSLRARLRGLSVDDLAVLREYEQAHAHRLPVLTMLDNRIAKLAAEARSAASTSSPDAGPTGSSEAGPAVS